MRLLSFYNDAICLCVQVFQFLSGTATGNAITVALGLLGFSVKIIFDKLDALQKSQLDTRKELGLIAQALNSLRIELKMKFVEQDTNIAWMRGDYGVVNRGSGPSLQGTKSSSTQTSGEEERSPEGEDDAATNPKCAHCIFASRRFKYAHSLVINCIWGFQHINKSPSLFFSL